MRILMFGTGPFAVPTFKSLIDSEHDILGLVTRPIQDSGKRRKTSENPTRDVALERGLSIFDPPSANGKSFVQQLNQLSADLFVVCDYGQILSRDCLAAARLGGINLHGSLLPKYRGAAPINWAIYHGDSVVGITIIHMTSKLDGGPCLAQASIPLTGTETAEDIEPDLASLGVQSVHDSIAMLSTWDGESPLGEKQDQRLATKAPRLQKSDGQIDWSQTAIQIVNQIRAFQPWPGTFTNWHAAHLKQPMRLIVHAAEVGIGNGETENGETGNGETGNGETGNGETEINESENIANEPALKNQGPGTVVACDKQRLVIQTGDGPLSLTQIQPAGKRAMPVADFLRGHQPKIGETLA